MPVKKKPAAKKQTKIRKAHPVYVCRACGLELIVTKGAVATDQFVCCDRVMKSK